MNYIENISLFVITFLLNIIMLLGVENGYIDGRIFLIFYPLMFLIIIILPKLVIKTSWSIKSQVYFHNIIKFQIYIQSFIFICLLLLFLFIILSEL